MTEKQRRLLKWSIPLLILFFVFCPCSSFLRIGLAQLKWNMTKPNAYRLTVYSYSDDWANDDSTVESIVEYGRIIHQVCSINIRKVVPCDNRISNRRIGVSDLFAYAWHGTYQEPGGGFRLENCLSSDFDLVYGYPRQLDYNCLGIIDEAHTYQTKIEPLE